MTQTISGISQQLGADSLVTLYRIDLSRYGLGTGYFAAEPDEDGNPLSWGGQEYQPVAIEADGFERKSGGAAARPTLTIANVNPLITSLVIEGDDLVGCEVRRYRTFRQFLDGGATPSVSDYFPPDIFRIERVKSRDKMQIVFELASVIDQEGVKIPRRQIVRDYCSYIYRRWDDTAAAWVIDAFDPCPYAGAAMFTRQGISTRVNNLDACGKHVRDCKLRFGETKLLFTRAYPGVGRVR